MAVGDTTPVVRSILKRRCRVTNSDWIESSSSVRRDAIERAIVAFISPHVLPLEKEFLDENKFKVAFQEFDWRLNDLTGGRVE